MDRGATKAAVPKKAAAPRVGVARVPALARVGAFLQEVWGELRKVAWPSRQDVYKLTGVVVMAVVIVAVYVHIMDSFLSIFTGRLFR